jgi:hypothetical protein
MVYLICSRYSESLKIDARKYCTHTCCTISHAFLVCEFTDAFEHERARPNVEISKIWLSTLRRPFEILSETTLIQSKGTRANLSTEVDEILSRES